MEPPTTTILETFVTASPRRSKPRTRNAKLSTNEYSRWVGGSRGSVTIIMTIIIMIIIIIIIKGLGGIDIIIIQGFGRFIALIKISLKPH